MYSPYRMKLPVLTNPPGCTNITYVINYCAEKCSATKEKGLNHGQKNQYYEGNAYKQRF